LEPRELRATSQGQYVFAELRRRTEHGDDIPMPVSNMIGPAVDNEVARLGRREYEAQTDTGNGSPDERNAARVAKGYLDWSHKVKKWPEKREAACFDLTLYSNATLKTFWDENSDDLYRIGSPDAVKCPMCPTVLSSPVVEMTQQEGLKNTEYADPEQGKLRLNVCPTCDIPMDKPEMGPELGGIEDPGEQAGMVMDSLLAPPRPRPDLIALQPYEVGKEEAETGVDLLGRPMGEDVPRGDTAYEVPSQFDLFPESGGMGVECNEVKMMGQRTVRSLDWIESHVPEWKGKLNKELPQDLMRAHPTFGEHGFAGGAQAESTYPNHAFLFEVHVEPSGQPGLEHGLSFIMCGNNVHCRPLCVDVEAPNGKTRM
jgi:hypothetical protein